MYFICKISTFKGTIGAKRDLIHVWFFFLYDSKVNAEDEAPRG